MTSGPEAPYRGPISEGTPHQHPAGGFIMSKLSRSTEVARAGITMGSALAIAISWSVNQSIVWAIIHGFFSWFYVIYYALTRN
jgi:hypothetical protein